MQSVVTSRDGAMWLQEEAEVNRDGRRMERIPGRNYSCRSAGTGHEERCSWTGIKSRWPSAVQCSAGKSSEFLASQSFIHFKGKYKHRFKYFCVLKHCLPPLVTNGSSTICIFAITLSNLTYCAFKTELQHYTFRKTLRRVRQHPLSKAIAALKFLQEQISPWTRLRLFSRLCAAKHTQHRCRLGFYWDRMQRWKIPSCEIRRSTMWRRNLITLILPFGEISLKCQI